MFKEKLQVAKQKVMASLGKGSSEEMDKNSKIILRKQIVRSIAIASSLIVVLWLLTNAVSDAKKSIDDGEDVAVSDSTKHNIDLADKALDTEVFWRNYFEEDMSKQKSNTTVLFAGMKESQEKMLSEVKASLLKTEQQVQRLNNQQKEQFELATKELKASLEEQRLLSQTESVKAKEVQLEAMGFDSEIEYDQPKSVEDYIPEGTFFTGYLLGGIVTETALNAPDEHTTSLTIILTGRGNLDPDNLLDISECRIEASAYGNLNSERAVVRLEKLICKDNGMWVTSDIAGIVHGDDGFDGVKGTVVATSTKHMKNAALGAFLGGISAASKGKEGVSLGANGITSSKSKSMGDLLGTGLMNGASNVSDEVARYYLKQAQAMSPVLTIPAGVKLNPKIEKGFFLGQRGMKARIKKDRKTNKGN